VLKRENVKEADDRAFTRLSKAKSINNLVASEVVDMPSGSVGHVLASLPGFSSRALIDYYTTTRQFREDLGCGPKIAGVEL
jgi:hypothetical protein